MPLRTGEAIRELRRANGVPQKALAEAAKLNPSTLSEIENGKADPQFSTIASVAGALLLKAHVNLFDVLGRQLEDDPSADLGETPTVPAQLTDTSDAASVRARRMSDSGTEAGRVTDKHFEDLEHLYRAAARGLDDQARKALVDEMELTAERFKQRMREGVKTGTGKS